MPHAISEGRTPLKNHFTMVNKADSWSCAHKTLLSLEPVHYFFNVANSYNCTVYIVTVLARLNVSTVRLICRRPVKGDTVLWCSLTWTEPEALIDNLIDWNQMGTTLLHWLTPYSANNSTLSNNHFVSHALAPN